MTKGRHFVKMCEHGYVHGQCRCPDPGKHVIPVKCTIVDHSVNPQPDALAEQMSKQA